MVFITGDTHAEFKYRFNTKNFPEQKLMTKGDFVIICGDFGGVWEKGGESGFEKYILDWFEERNYTLLFIDGNHENFDRLNAYPVKEWKGGKVHEIRPHVLHLMRGQVFEIGGKSFFTFGGASSHDVSGGILEPDDPDFHEKKARMQRNYEPFRINHVTWWKEEMPNEEEWEEGKRNLLAHGNAVDFIITHCCATSTQASFAPKSLYPPDAHTDYLDEIKNTVVFQKWFFGHYHFNEEISENEELVYEKMVRVI